MIPTQAQLTALRSKPNLTKLYLSVYQPTTVLACRVNEGSITKGDRTITFDTVTAGSYLLVQSGMTMYVGSTAGTFDKGVIRVRSATSSVITVAENSHINWSDNDYLTVVSFYEINAVYPRIIQDPADATKTIWYKDYDIAYTNQNSVLGSFINMGSHYAGFIENGSCNVYYSASGTSNLRGDTLSYHWFFEGATVTGSSVLNPGNITYNTPGHYTTRLIVSGSSTGAVDVSYRHISIYNRPGEGANVPLLNWELLSFSGSREQGGYSVRIRLHEMIPPSTLKDGSLVVIFAEDWYGDQVTKQSIGGNSLGRQSIVFSGYVLQGSIQYDYRDSYVDFDLGSPTEMMKQSEGFGISVQHSNDPSTATSDPDIPSGWVTILNMDVKRAMYHYFRWHSTVLMTTDIHFMGTDRAVQYFDADRSSLFDAINTFIDGAYAGNVVCDRQGAIWLERSIIADPATYGTSMTLTNQDWMEDISIDERRGDRTAFIELGGIAFSGSTGTYTALLANAPGVAPGYKGTVERKQGLALISQNELNALAGNLFAYRNCEYPQITIKLAGDYRNFDIAPQEKVVLNIAASDTKRGITFTNKNFFINRMQWSYSPRMEMFKPEITVAELTSGFDGDTVIIPATPDIPTSGFNIPTMNVPQIIFPPYPTIPIASSGTTSSTSLFVQALGGYYFGNTPAHLVYGGGPFPAGLVEFYSAGLSFNSGRTEGTPKYCSANLANGLFLVPNSTFTVRPVFILNNAGASAGESLTFFGECLEILLDGSEGSGYVYYEDTFDDTLTGHQVYDVDNVNWTFTDFTVGSVCQIYFEVGYDQTLQSTFFFLGWLIEWA